VRIRALVFTTTDKPGMPCLETAWDIDSADAEDRAQEALADLLTTPHTHRAKLVDVDVPDDRLLQLLDRPTPLALGVVAEDPTTRKGPPP